MKLGFDGAKSKVPILAMATVHAPQIAGLRLGWNRACMSWWGRNCYAKSGS